MTIKELDIPVDAFVIKRIADLRIQALMFDMDIDWEAGKLIPKTAKYNEPFWITRWRESQAASDSTVIDNGF